jgi:asparagine synthetase B (glutamine-hydrolysing)
MAGIAGLIVTSEEYNSESILQEMSDAIRHRRCDSFHTVRHDNSQCMIMGSRSFDSIDDDLIIIDRNKDLILSDGTKSENFVSDFFGVVVVIVNKTGLRFIRTKDGTRTLYYGTMKNLFAFATERKSLWKIGVTKAHVLEPGEKISVSWQGNIVAEKVVTLEKPQRVYTSQNDALAALRRALLESFGRLRRDISCSVLFSGGVDSSLVATLAARRCKSTILVTTRSEGAHDGTVAASAASQLGLPLFTITLDSRSIWEILPQVIYSIESSRQLDVEIALPFYLAAQKAGLEGCTTVISGQGPDELFGGYARHVQIYNEKGPDALAQQLLDEVSVTHEANIERDERAIAAHGVESFFPYLNQQFVRTSLSVPIDWKVNPTGKPQRKVIFRKLAQLMGVSDEIANAPKSATQYSSGSARAILDSVAEHVEGFSNMSRKKVSRRVQDVLNEIANEIELPTVQKKDRHLHLDLEPVRKFLSKLESSSSSNTR